jgi:phosphohistidine phosphatase
MKSVFIIRHADAVDGFDLPDSFRQLSKRGIEQSNYMGSRFTDLPSLWYVSPALRTYATAHILSKHQKKTPIIELCSGLYNSRIENYIDQLVETDDLVESVAIIGHNPTVSELAYELGKYTGIFKKGSIAKINFEISSWTQVATTPGSLEFFEIPAM